MNTQEPVDAVPDDLIDTKTARRLVKVDLSTLYRWLQSGKLRAWKRVGRLLVSRSEVLALLRPVEPKPARERAPRRATQATAAQRAWLEREADRLGL